MSLRSCQNNGRQGFQYGENGACFTGRNARQKALRQGVAQEAKANEHFNYKPFKDCTESEFAEAVMESDIDKALQFKIILGFALDKNE